MDPGQFKLELGIAANDQGIKDLNSDFSAESKSIKHEGNLCRIEDYRHGNFHSDPRISATSDPTSVELNDTAPCRIKRENDHDGVYFSDNFNSGLETGSQPIEQDGAHVKVENFQHNNEALKSSELGGVVPKNEDKSENDSGDDGDDDSDIPSGAPPRCNDTIQDAIAEIISPRPGGGFMSPSTCGCVLQCLTREIHRVCIRFPSPSPPQYSDL